MGVSFRVTDLITCLGFSVAAFFLDRTSFVLPAVTARQDVCEHGCGPSVILSFSALSHDLFNGLDGLECCPDLFCLPLCPPMTYVHHEVTGEGEGAPNGDSTCVMTKDHAAAFKKVDNP